MTHTAHLAVGLIDDTDRLRPVDPAWAEALAASMGERGLDQPIVVRSGGGAGYQFQLVAGGHRLAAAKRLGWSEIRAEVVELDNLQARLVEIDENLVRHELTALDRGLFLIERKRVYEQLHPAAAHGGDRKSQKRKAEIRSPSWRLDARFSAEAAEKVGLSERTIQRAIECVAGLAPETIQALRGTSLVDNAVQLRSLSEDAPDRQLVYVKAIAGGVAANVAAARIKFGHVPAGEGDPQEIAFRKLVAAWDRAGRDARRRFMAHAALVRLETVA